MTDFVVYIRDRVHPDMTGRTLAETAHRPHPVAIKVLH